MLLFYVKKNDISYRLATATSVYNETSTVVVYLDTVGIPDGTVVDYTISGSGITATDFSPSSLSGSLTIQSNTASTSFSVATDQLSEGTETALIRLTNGRSQVSFSITDTSLTAYYLVTANPSPTPEGGVITYTLTTLNVPDGTLVDYTISGSVAQPDYNELPSGSFVVYNNTATLSVPIIADELTEGVEDITLTLTNGHGTVTVSILDTSKAQALNLMSSKIEANEGSTISFVLTTENVPDGTSYPYTLSGIASLDVDVPLTGTFVVTGGSSTVVVNLLNDNTLEGDETITLTLDDSLLSTSVVIRDTSFPVTYSLTSSSSVIDEGLNLTFTLATEGVPNNTVVPYVISGVTTEDLEGFPLTNNFTVIDNFASVQIPIAADFVTEGTEYVTLELDNGLSTSTVQINDSTRSQTFALGTSTGVVNEGGSVTFELASVNVPDGTAVAYTITGVASSDIDSHPLTGTFTITNNASSETFLITKDYLTDGNQTLTLTLDNGKATASALIVDTSKTQSFVVTPSATMVDEGTSVTFVLVTENVDDNTNFGYQITGVATGDLGDPLTGNFTVIGNTAQVTIVVNSDQLTEGAETLTLTLTNLRASASVLITDTSRTKTYTLTATPTIASEGSTVEVSLQTQNVVDGTQVPYTITGLTNLDVVGGVTAGVFNILNGTSTISFDILADQLTEGTENGTLTLDGNLGSVTFEVTDTSKTPTYSLTRSITTASEGDTITFNLVTTYVSDSTLVPYTITGVTSADISAAPLTGNFDVQGGSAALVLTTTSDQFTEGTETIIVTLDNGKSSSSVTLNDTSKTRTYSLSSNTGTFYEGSSVVFTLSTTNVPDNTTIGYTISGTNVTSSDLGGASLTGNFTVVSNSSTLAINFTQDGLTEGIETVTVSLTGGLGSVSVTVDDMSLATPFLSKTALYLKGDGANNGINSTIKDTSGNNLTVTRYGTVTQGTTSPFSRPKGYWSSFYRGDFSSVLASSANYGLGTGDFTVECWVTTNDTTIGRTLIDFRASGSAATQNKVVLKFTTAGTFGYFLNGAARITTTAIEIGKWHHVALCRASGVTKLYVDGVQRGVSYSDTGTKGATSDISVCQDGVSRSSPTSYWYGCVSNLRIIKYAVYTTNFTPSTTPLTSNVNGVEASILMLNDKYFKTSDDITSSYDVKGWGPNMTTESPFIQVALDSAVNINNGSLNFVDLPDYLKIAHSVATEPGASDFTLELFYNVQGENWSEYPIYTKRASASVYSSIVLALGENNTPKFYAATTAGTWAVLMSSSVKLYIGSWSHIAVTRSGTTWSLWVNGTLGATMQASGTVTSSTAVSAISSQSAADVGLAGGMRYSIAGLRFVKGTSLYNSPFVPPSAIPTAIAGTGLLLTGTNGSIYDSVAKNNFLLYGNVKISTTQSKQGGSSVYLDGNGDYLTAPETPSLTLLSGEFSIDVWVYMTAAPSSSEGSFIFSKDGIAYSTAPQYRIGITPTRSVWFESYGTILMFHTMVLNTWTHLAVSRVNGTLTAYVNGTSTATAAWGYSTVAPTGRPLYIGWEDAQPVGSYFSGYIENLRIIKGSTLFTSNFDPSTLPF